MLLLVFSLETTSFFTRMGHPFLSALTFWCVMVIKKKGHAESALFAGLKHVLVNAYILVLGFLNGQTCCPTTNKAFFLMVKGLSLRHTPTPVGIESRSYGLLEDRGSFSLALRIKRGEEFLF